jgi:hypothetical protein
MHDFSNGKYVSGFLASNDISTAAAIPLFDANGNAVTLAVGERLIIETVSLNNGATASKITLFADTNGGGTLDAGEELYAATLAANSNNSPTLNMPILGRRIGATTAINKLFAVASAASVGTVVFINGQIVTS